MPYNRKFRLYLTTILRTPAVSYELGSKMCVVNFTMGQTQLMEQLTTTAFINDHVDLENERRDLQAQRVRYNQLLREVEGRVLDAVNAGTAEGIIEDEGFVRVLQESQRTAREIQKKAQQISSNERRVDAIRKQYANSVGKIEYGHGLLPLLLRAGPILNGMYCSQRSKPRYSSWPSGTWPTSTRRISSPCAGS